MNKINVACNQLIFVVFFLKLVYLILQKRLIYKFTILNVKYKRVKEFEKNQN